VNIINHHRTPVWVGFVVLKNNNFQKTVRFISIPSPMSKICCFGNEVRFPETPILLGFGKSASRNERNKYQIGEGIEVTINFQITIFLVK